jgi:hypothetical protein
MNTSTITNQFSNESESTDSNENSEEFKDARADHQRVVTKNHTYFRWYSRHEAQGGESPGVFTYNQEVEGLLLFYRKKLGN